MEFHKVSEISRMFKICQNFEKKSIAVKRTVRIFGKTQGFFVQILNKPVATLLHYVVKK